MLHSKWKVEKLHSENVIKSMVTIIFSGMLIGKTIVFNMLMSTVLPNLSVDYNFH